MDEGQQSLVGFAAVSSLSTIRLLSTRGDLTALVIRDCQHISYHIKMKLEDRKYFMMTNPPVRTGVLFTIHIGLTRTRLLPRL